MDFFQRYVSNTSAGSGNQFFFTGTTEFLTGRIFYQVNTGGQFAYSFLFSNILDSTFADGSVSHKNLICDTWEIGRMSAGACEPDFFAAGLENVDMERICGMTPVTFDGAKEKIVTPGTFFATDPVLLDVETGGFICLEIAFRGKMIPYHEESIIPAYRKNAAGWTLCKQMPYAGMVGCSRPAACRIGFLGDSITQGIGTEMNSYTHWNARLANQLGDQYAFWNLGLGYGRANDAASDGAWLFKAKQNDVAVVCFGVNDILQGFSAEEIKRDLTGIVDKLQAAGVKVVLQTVPPFDYAGGQRETWLAVNAYILQVLEKKAELVFDVVPVLRESGEAPERAKYGGHPNAAGCRAWADALLPPLKAFLEKNFK